MYLDRNFQNLPLKRSLITNEYLSGDLLESEAKALVSPVNCVGVMGKGLAMQFKQRYPSNYIFYKQACREGRVRPGHVLVFELEPTTSDRGRSSSSTFRPNAVGATTAWWWTSTKASTRSPSNSSGVAFAAWRSRPLDVVWEDWRGLASSC
jgi:hypothetical protein